MIHNRRSFLSTVGIAIPFAPARAEPSGTDLEVRFRPFAEAVREAFHSHGSDRPFADGSDQAAPWCRLEVGESEEVRAGVQGCYNDHPFAGFPAGHLRIVRSGSEPGPARYGVRLYVWTVDVMVTGGRTSGSPGRPLDFATLPPAPVLGPATGWRRPAISAADPSGLERPAGR